jgi:hypothetical protein
MGRPIVIQIALFKMLAEPPVTLNIVRSQISLLAGIQSVEVRTHPRCTLRLVLICSYQIISRGLILAGARWRTQWICWRRLRTTDDIVPLGRVLLSGRVLRIRCACEKQCGTYQRSEIGRFQDVLLKAVIAPCAKPGCSDADAVRDALCANYVNSRLASVRHRTHGTSPVSVFSHWRTAISLQ